MENQYKIRLENNGIRVLDPEIKKAINKKTLSPSMISGFLASPGDWIMNSFIMPEIEIEPTPHLRRGNWFHSIMEDFFAKPQTERTYMDLKNSIQKVSKELYPDMLQTEENKDWLRNAIEGYKNSWLDGAKDEKIAKVFINGETKSGIELAITGKIGDVKKNCFGYIDKVIEGESGLIIQDWKTGKTISNFDPNKKMGPSNPFDYWRQQIFYTMLLEQKGMIVEGANLAFPCSTPPTIVNVDINNKFAREQVIKDVEAADKEIAECIENDYFFPFKKGKYNSWASYLCGMGTLTYPLKIHSDKLQLIMEMG